MFKAKRAIYENDKGHHDYFSVKTHLTIHLALGKKSIFPKSRANKGLTSSSDSMK